MATPSFHFSLRPTRTKRERKREKGGIKLLELKVEVLRSRRRNFFSIHADIFRPTKVYCLLVPLLATPLNDFKQTEKRTDTHLSTFYATCLLPE